MKKLNLIIKVSTMLIAVALLVMFSVLPSANKPPNEEEPKDPNDSSSQTQSYEMDVVDISKQKYTYAEMVDDLALLSERYAGKMSYESVGRSLDGRNLYAVTLGNPEAKKQIVITAGVHAREYMTPMLVMRQLEYYLYSYDTESYKGIPLSEIFDEYAFCIMPMCNPDGISLSQFGLNGIRSEELRNKITAIYEADKQDGFVNGTMNDYLSVWKANARGVDINRNFDTEDFSSSSKMARPSFMNYHGESAESEPETKAMADFVRDLENPVLSIAVHSQGEVIYFNCGQKNYDEAHDFGASVSDLTKYVLQYSLRRDSAFDDWCNKNMQIPAITVETGSLPCPLPISEFDEIWAVNRDLWLFSALYHKGLQ